MKLFIALLVLLMFPATSIAEDAITSGGTWIDIHTNGTWTPKKFPKNAIMFRGIKWGASRKTVKAATNMPVLTESDEIVMYNETLARFPAQLIFLFSGDVYTAGGYLLQQKHINNNKYFDDYSKILDALTKKYGPPDVVTNNFKDPSYQTDTARWGMWLAIGSLSLQREWHLDGTEIIHALYGDNAKVTHKVIYTHESVKGIQKAAQQKNNASKL